MLRSRGATLDWIMIAMAAATPFMLCGCDPQSGPSGPEGGDISSRGGPPLAANSNAVWPFWPSQMRVHPLTKIVRDPDTGQHVIEARIEFRDHEGTITKAVGQLALQIYAGPAVPNGPMALQTWNQDLRDLDINRRQHDDVTRTYLFRLQVNPAELPEDAELRVFFLSATGTQLEATRRIR